MRRIIAVSSLAGLAGCFPISFNIETSTSATMSVGLGDLSGTCAAGSTVVEDADSKATVTKTPTATTCEIKVDFEATAVDMADVRAKIDEKIREKGHSPADVDLSLRAPTTLTFSDIHVTGVTIPSTGWALDASLEELPLFEDAGNDLAALQQAGASVELSAAQLAIISAAYSSSGPVTVKGQVVLIAVPLDYIKALPQGTNASIDFAIVMDTTAKASVETF